MTDTFTASLAADWPTLLAAVLLLATGYVYAYRQYDPIIRNLKQQVTQLQWQLHDLKNERDALWTRLERTQVSDTPGTEQPADDLKTKFIQGAP